MWICDGYIQYTVKETYQRSEGFSGWQTIAVDTRTYVYNHFNWGWDHTNNGYFIDQVFTPNYSHDDYSYNVNFIRLTR